LSTGLPATRSREEVASAIRTFSPADWARLRMVARKYAAGRPIEADDLLQEAMVRAVDSRVCPADVDVVRFLAEAMRSIAHGEREKAENKLVLVSVPKSGEPTAEALAVPDPAPNAVALMISEEDAARIRGAILTLFDDDPQARDIVEGTMEEMSAEELRELTGLSLTAYNSKRRLIRRRIDNAFPQGWKL
jgi:DNA-directed RNA polymerase specialized sigma24 family protein